MKRFLVPIGFLLLLAIALVAAIPFFISTDLVKERILDEARKLTGREMTFRGNPAVSFNPFLGIEILDVTIADPLTPQGGRPFLQMEKMKAKLKLLPAFLGQVDITDFQFFRPQLNLKTNTSGQANWTLTEGQIRTALDARTVEVPTGEDATRVTPPTVAIGRFEIVDGSLDYENAISGISQKFTNLNGTINWPTTDSPFQIDTAGIWQGEQFGLSLQASNLLEFAAGGDTKLTYKLTSAPVNVNFSGQADLISDMHLVGDIAIASPSFNRLTQFFHFSVFDNLFFGELSVAGKIDATPNAASLTEASVTVGGNQSNGLLQWSFNEENIPKIDGTLAFASVNLDEFFQAISEYRTVADTPQAGAADERQTHLDIRLSASAIRMFGIEAADFAATLSSTRGVWFLDIGNLSAFDGTIIAKLESDLNDLSPKFKLSAGANNLDLARVFEALGTTTLQPSGKLKLKIESETSGDTRYEIAKNTNGRLEASVQNARLTSIDFTKLYDTLNENSLRLSQTEVAGATDLTELEIVMSVQDGIAWTTDNRLVSNTHKMTMIGNADLYLGGLALRADLTPMDNSGEAVRELIQERRSFFVGGTIASPLLTRWKLGTNGKSD